MTSKVPRYQGTKIPREHWLKTYVLEIKKESKPFCVRPYKISQSYRKSVVTEVARLTKIGLLTRVTKTQ